MLARLVLFFLFIGIAEIYLLLKVGALIGFWWTLATIVVTAILGATLTKMQGAATMMKAQLAMREGRMPHAEALDGLLIIVAGAVLLTPGFLTDALGFALLLPPVRAVLRSRLAKAFRDKIQVITPQSADHDDDVIEAEVLED